MWPLFVFLGKCHTINIAINIYTEVTLEPNLNGSKIILKSLDLNRERVFENLADLNQDSDPSWLLLKEVILFFKPESGFVLTTKSGSPVGGGLGGSSSLVISLIKAFAQWLRVYPDFTVHNWVEVAHNIEARILSTPTGTQDYYPAFQGGLNCITYQDTGVSLETLPLANFNFSSCYFLVDTGKSHNSGLNNFDVLTRAVRKEGAVLNALKSIQKTSQTLWDEIHTKPLEISWIEIFEREYSARVSVSPTFSSPEIEKLRSIVSGLLPKGEFGIKILGAGGGGCVLVWVRNDRKIQLAKDTITSNGFRVLPIEFVDVL
jgi:D-glycero-alpha-D-manno-heptose-7-phosphate kinase